MLKVLHLQEQRLADLIKHQKINLPQELRNSKSFIIDCEGHSALVEVINIDKTGNANVIVREIQRKLFMPF